MELQILTARYACIYGNGIQTIGCSPDMLGRMGSVLQYNEKRGHKT